MASILRYGLAPVRYRSLFLCLLICWCLAALPSRSLAQLSHQTGLQWRIDPVSQKPFFTWKSNDNDSASGSGWSVKMDIFQTWDDYRQIQGGPLVVPGNLLAGSSLVGAGKEKPNIVPGEKLYGTFSGTATLFKITASGTGAYPSGSVSSGLSSGRYICRVAVSHGDGTNESADLLLFSVAGQFFTEQQGPAASDPIAPGNFDPSLPSGSSLCSVMVHVEAASSATSSGAAGYSCKLVTTSKVYATTTDPQGNALFSRVPVQSYTLQVTGSHASTAGTTIYDAASGPINVKAGAITTASVVFGNSGTGTLASVDPNTANGAASGGGGSSSDNNNQQSWWGQVFTYLFVPQQSTLDAVKADATQFANWGPGVLLNELTAAFNSQVQSMPGLVIPNFWYDTTINVDSHGRSYGGWRPTGDAGTVIDPTAGAGALPGMQTLRSWLGAGVWITFALGVGRRMMPQQVM